GDGHVNAVTLARDVPEQVRLATGLADDDVLRTLTRGQRVRRDRRTGREVDLLAGRSDRQRESVGAEHRVTRVAGNRRIARGRIRVDGRVRERRGRGAQVLVRITRR